MYGEVALEETKGRLRNEWVAFAWKDTENVSY
jgi:hypothetical protein